MSINPDDIAGSRLAVALSAAVPLWIEQLKSLPWSRIQEIARECGQVVAEHGDLIQFRSNKKGQSAAAFNALVKGIACLSFAPGGVRCFGSHWQATLENP